MKTCLERLQIIARKIYLCSQSSASSFKPGCLVRSMRAVCSFPKTSVFKAESQFIGYSMRGDVKACNDMCIDFDSGTRLLFFMTVGMIIPACSHHYLYHSPQCSVHSHTAFCVAEFPDGECSYSRYWGWTGRVVCTPLAASCSYLCFVCCECNTNTLWSTGTVYWTHMKSINITGGDEAFSPRKYEFCVTVMCI